MKRIILLSTLVITQTIFATTLTIYNSNIALVQDSVEFEITKNDEEVIYKDIPNTLVSNSVNFDLPQEVSLLSQTYKRKSLTQHDLAKNFVGKNVTLANGSIVKLLSLSGNNAVVQNLGGEVLTSKISDIVFPYLPKTLQADNSLNLHIQATKDLKTNIDITYLAKNISFSNDYILNIDKNKADLQAWVDITNNSGKDFNNVKVNLLAGDINRAHNYRDPIMLRSSAPVAMDKNNISHKSIAGYHKYTLPTKVNLKSFEKSRIKLFDYKDIAITNHYKAHMSNPLYLMGERSSNVERSLSLKGIKQVMPSGIVRIYTKDDDGLMLLGEESIKNIPKNTPTTLRVGKDFDTKVTQKVLSRKDTKKLFDVNIEYSVINHSDEEKTVTVEIPFTKKEGAEIRSHQKYNFVQNNLVTFKVTLKANSKHIFAVNFKSKRR